MHNNDSLRTISLGDSGTLSASATSCTFWLTLAFLVLIVLKASLRLFCRPCAFLMVVGGGCADALKYPFLWSLRGCHLSDGALLFERCLRAGLGVRDELSPNGSSSWVGRRSGWNAGNLKVAFGFESSGDAETIARAVRRSWRVRYVVREAMRTSMMRWLTWPDCQGAAPWKYRGYLVHRVCTVRQRTRFD
jgi:hypothetical protein